MSSPTIAVVTPSFQQGAYVEATLSSVLGGSVAPDEYVVADGGSTDGSVEILERYAPRLTAWWSERDGGQYDAVERAFARTSADVMGWLNSDDLYMPWTLAVVRDVFTQHPEVDWLTTLYPLTVDAAGCVVDCVYTGGFDRGSFRDGRSLPSAPGAARGVQQESTFWRRSLWERAGSRLDTSLRLAGDFELWHRFAKHAELVGVETPLAAFRVHPAQKTSSGLSAYLAEGMRVVGDNQAPSARRVRRLVSAAIGRRSLKRLPAPVGRGLVAARLVRRTQVCAWREGGWRLYDDYVA